MELNQIHNMDCIEGVDIIHDQSVDLLITDPPYNVSRQSNFHTMGRKGVDFGDWDKEFNQQEWLDAFCPKVRKGGSVVVFNDYKNVGYMTEALERNGLTVKQMLIWKKTNPMPRNRDRLYVTSFEIALWAVKGKGWAFNRQRDTYENGFFEYPATHHSKRFHPTQKPEPLIEDLITIHSNKGDTILDPFMGSGTTAVACQKTGRKYIGFELDKGYYDTALERIEAYGVK